MRDGLRADRRAAGRQPFRLLVSVLVMLAGLSVATAALGSAGPDAHRRPRTIAYYRAPASASKAQMAKAKEVLAHRLRAFGVTGATVTVHRREVVVSLARTSNSTRVLTTLGERGNLFFRPALCYAPLYSPSATPPPPGSSPSCGSPYALVTANLKGTSNAPDGAHYTVGSDPALAGYLSTSPTEANYENETVLLPGLKPSEGRYLLGPTELTGRIVKKAVAHKTTVGRWWVVDITLTRAGTTAWNAMAEQYFHEVIGIELDGVVETAPLTLPSASSFTPFGGRVQISGGFTKFEAQTVAAALDYGSLPVPLDLVETSTRG